MKSVLLLGWNEDDDSQVLAKLPRHLIAKQKWTTYYGSVNFAQPCESYPATGDKDIIIVT